MLLKAKTICMRNQHK